MNFYFFLDKGERKRKTTPQPFDDNPQHNRNGIKNCRIVVPLMAQTSQEVSTCICFTVDMGKKSGPRVLMEGLLDILHEIS